jgi:hypothetical protein
MPPLRFKKLAAFDFLSGPAGGAALSSEALFRINMEHHGRKGNTQPYGFLLAVQYAGITVPAFFGVSDHGYLFLLGTEDIRGTYVGAQPAGVAFLLDNDRWHNEILLYESN